MVLGLLSPAERKNCWWLAEHAGHGDPQAMQRLLRTAMWDADAVRDDLRAFVAAQLGDAAGVLICDETGFLKKGSGSVGVQPIQRHRRADRELPGRRVRVLRLPARPGADRPPDLPAEVMDR
jgi:SRSO17 transposase